MSKTLQAGLLQLSKFKKEFEDKYRVYVEANDTLTTEDQNVILRSLSDSIVKPSCSLLIARCFPQLVLELLTLPQNRPENVKQRKDKFIALGKLVRIHPDVIRFSEHYFSTCEFPLSALSVHINAGTLTTEDRKLVTEVLKSCYSFLQTNNEHFRHRKDWSVLLGPFLHNKSLQVVWLTCQCIAAVTGMSDYQRHRLVSQRLPENVCNKFTVHYGSDKRLESIEASIQSETTEVNEPIPSLTVVSVGGIQLPIFDPQQVEASWFLAAHEFNLRHIALAVANGKAVCLKGPVGCGKTALVEHLARLTGRRAPHFVKVQLGDQTDSKTLLGTYQCTDVAGEFVWTAGVLTRAVLDGGWLLLEDIDSAAVDVATIVTALLETGELAVPGYRETVRAAPGFQLFLTQRSVGGHGRHQTVGSLLLEKHWVQINLDPLNYDQLVTLVETMFPPLKSVSTRMVDVFTTLQDCADTICVGRQSSTRDLIKWCSRNIHTFHATSRNSTLKIFQDALDIFCQHISKPEWKLKLAVRIASCLGLTEAQAAYYCGSYKPNISATNTHFTTGRVQTEIMQEQAKHSRKAVFSLTRPAACLLESVQACVEHNEPTLLVGETGTGKTSAVQHLAERTGRHLVAINMNQQSDSADLLGGYKPVDVKYVVYPVREEFEWLLRASYSANKVDKLIKNIGIFYNQQRWRALCRLMKQVASVVTRDLADRADKAWLELRWTLMMSRLDKMEAKLWNAGAMAFAFIEGSLVQALTEGWWVLLDEINLASAETLECLSGLLEGSTGSLHMLERGDKVAVTRHKHFRLFACMNPATDVGKKELPVGLRNRFTEFFVGELSERSDLTQLVGSYLRGLSLVDAKLDNLVSFYLNIRTKATTTLTDATGHKPHYSLRTLCRALAIASRNACGSTPRSLYEALCVSFLTQLDQESHMNVERMIAIGVVNKNEAKSILHQPIPEPAAADGKGYSLFEGYWVPKGRLEPDIPEKYILTACVRHNLRDLVRVISVGRLPVLVQGETSVGKTSLVEYVARASGNRCVRINNHEHTDLQEYVGAYAADEHGKLVFKEGALVQAMRKGEWIILDELNLAPSDVLEALNRVLDDNRQLFIPETRETIDAHHNFMVFATQNPPGLYGGRKVLSRAFRNRFVELHFNEIPPAELEVILHQRCDLPPSYCKKLVAVMTELQVRRKGSSAFAGKQGFITLRDLFRWGERYRLANNQALAGKLYDWDQHIADEGYLILAGRVRKKEERAVICQVLQTHIKRKVEPEKLFTLSDKTSPVTQAILERLVVDPPSEFRHIVWTYNMRRLAVLVGS